MRKAIITFLSIALAVAATISFAAPTSPTLSDINVPFTKVVLANGLTLIVHEDHAAPLVAVNIWYHVGSKNEPKGRSGFAHLFEHLMFNGSENYNDDFFKLTQKIGASDQNGTTSEDRTNYFQTVPKGALDTILWLESDRMGHLLGAIDQAKLDEQRKVVQNEKRGVDNRPYAKAEDLITRATFPVGHPYDHSVLGSMEDLNAASLEDVKEWFRTYYGPTNAVLVLAGDITPSEAKAKVEKYFGDIAPGTPVAHPQSWTVKRTGTQRETAYDRVAQPRLYRIWNISEYTSADAAYLQFLGLVLAGDTRIVHIKPLIETAFAGWKPATVPATTAPVSAGPAKSVVYLLDRPGTPQAVIRAALIAPPQSEGDEIARQTLNNTLGGSFTSRLNMKLREEKGWAYGAGSGFGGGGRGSRIFSASASVQTDKTAESMSEISSALKSIIADRKVNPNELIVAKDDMTLGLSSAWSTSAGVADYLFDVAYNRLPENYYEHYGSNIAAKSVDQVNAAAAQLIGSRPLTWIVAGDLEKIEAGIRQLNLGEVKVIDADGKVLR